LFSSFSVYLTSLTFAGSGVFARLAYGEQAAVLRWKPCCAAGKPVIWRNLVSCAIYPLHQVPVFFEEHRFVCQSEVGHLLRRRG
jgi:hypothetical protein